MVAQSQLETAIRLWFTGGDPVSIHALAVAAQDCYRALAERAKPKMNSPFQEWAESQPKRFQEKLRIAQNFFKHGPNKFKGKVHLMPKHTDVLMFDAAVCHERLFGRERPLLFLYCLRFCVENPHLGATVFAPGMEWLKTKVPVNVSRNQLFQLFLEAGPFLAPPPT